MVTSILDDKKNTPTSILSNPEPVTTPVKATSILPSAVQKAVDSIKVPPVVKSLSFPSIDSLKPKVAPAPLITDDSPLGIAKNTILGLPKAAWDILPFGKIYNATKDYLNDPTATPLSPSDLGAGIVQATKDVVATPIADVAGVFTGPKTYKVPVIGSVTNIQKVTSNAIQNGENPYAAVVTAVPQSIFDGLMVAGLAEKVFSPREQVVATGVKTNDLPASSEIPAERNFRITPKATSASHPIPPEIINSLPEQGINLKGYNPENPTFFRTTPLPNGMLKGEIVQIKPSYFDSFMKNFGGDISNTPPEFTSTVYEQNTSPEQLKNNLEQAPTPTKDNLQSLAQNIKEGKSLEPKVSVPTKEILTIASQFKPKIPSVEGIDKNQSTMVTNEEASPLAEKTATAYYDQKVTPAINNGKAIVIGGDDIKDHFGKDYNDNNHPIYSKAADAVYKRAVVESPEPTVKFTVGGTGSGKSDFLVPDLSDNFKGIVYDSTGWNYAGLKKQIDFARENGKTPEVYAIIPDIERSRAYTFLREARGEHPVNEQAFIRTHSGSIQTLIKLIQDGVDVHVLDTRNLTSEEEVDKAEYVTNPLALLESLGYSESNVKDKISKINPENAQAIIERRQAKIKDLSETNRSDKEIENGLQTGTTSLRKGGKGKEPTEETSSGSVGTSTHGDVIQAAQRIADYTGEDGERAKLVVRQAKRLSEGKEITINEDTYSILREAGYSNKLVDNLQYSKEKGGVNNLVLTDEIDGEDLISAYKENTIYLNPKEIDHPIYEDGSIINHELAGHSWYLKLSDSNRASFYSDLKNNKATIQEAWSDTDNPYKDYWQRTINQIANQILEKSNTEATDRIISDFGLTFDDSISLDQFIDQSLDLDTLITAVNTELSRIGRSPIDLKAHNTIAIQEHVAMIAEKSDVVETNEDSVGSYVSDIKDGSLKYGTEATKDLIYQGETDLTIKTLEKLKGRATVSKQFIQDLTNSPDLKQAEKNVVREVLAGYPDDAKIPVKQFAEDVKIELLPLEIRELYTGDRGARSARYESITLPDNLRGNVADYRENVYQSPIKTSAGGIHFVQPENPNYFGHTRIEDMAKENNIDKIKNQIKPLQDKLDQRMSAWKTKNPGKHNTSDLGDLSFFSQSEMKEYTDLNAELSRAERLAAKERVEAKIANKSISTSGSTRRVIEVQSDLYQKGNLEKEISKPLYGKDHIFFSEDQTIGQHGRTIGDMETRNKEVSKLQQYNDPTAHFRMVREEVRKAAQDGKTKLQFPTGETAMKIEGLSEPYHWFNAENGRTTTRLTTEEIKVGNEINGHGGTWIITDVLGDGKFKAVPKQLFGSNPKDLQKAINDSLSDPESSIHSMQETFDISGKVDTSNPIYKFYEKDLGRYLKNQYNAKPVTDEQGVTWHEVDIKPEMATQPVVAFRKGTTDIEHLQRMLDREKQSLDAVVSNPEAHAMAYGENRAPVYKARIEELKQRIKEAKNPTFDTGNKLEDLKQSLQAVEARTGVTPVEREKLIEKGNKYNFEVPDLNRYTATDLILQENPLKGHPATPFLKYVNPRTGELPPIHEETPGVYGREMNHLLEKKGMTYEQAQLEVNNYIENAQLLDQLYEDRFNPLEIAGAQTIVTTPIFETEAARLNERDGKPLETMLNESDPIPLKRKVGIVDYLRTPGRVLQKIGLEDESKLIKKKYADYLKELPLNIQKITDWSKRLPKTTDGKPTTQRIFDYLNGGNVDENGFLKPDFLTVEETKVAKEIKAWLEEWADRLKIPHHERISNYITHVFEDDLVKKEFDDELAKIIQGKVAGQVYDPFLEKRLGALGYKRDAWAALDAYVKRATRKVHMDVALEQVKIAAKKLDIDSYNYVNKYVDRINLRPTETDKLIDTSIKQMIGYRFGQRPVARLSKIGRQMVFRGTLGLNVGSALKNLMQGVNTYSKLGEKYTIIGYTKLLNRLNHQELYDEGILGNDLVQDRSLSSTKKFWEKTDKALFYLFETVEHINRGSAYFGAKAKYYAENSKTEKGVQVWKAGSSKTKAREYAKKLVEDTQFTFGSVDTPMALQSDISKTLFQFQSFNVKQAEFLTEMAKNKNYAGLIRFILATLAFGYSIGKLFGFKWQDMIPFSRYSLPPIPAAITTIAGALLNTNDSFGNPRTLKEKATDILNTATPFIPAYIQGNKTFQGIKSIKQGETKNPFDEAKAVAFGPKTLEASPVSKQLNKNIKTAQTKLDAFDSGIIKEMEAKYTEAKAVGLDSDEAQKIVDDLSDSDYTIYKAVVAVENAKDSLALEPKILPIVLKASLLGFDTDEADQLVTDSFPDTPEGDKEFAVFKSIKNSMKDVLADNTNSKWKDQTFVEHVSAYAKALGTDPVTLFKDLFAGNQSYRILGVTNGQVMVARADQSVTDPIREKRGATKDMILDHTISIEAGGDNSNDNLLLIPKGDENTPGTWAWNTPTENIIGDALKQGLITGAKAREYNIRFKMTAGENLSPALQKEFKDKYKSQPLTPDQIKVEISK